MVLQVVIDDPFKSELCVDRRGFPTVVLLLVARKSDTSFDCTAALHLTCPVCVPVVSLMNGLLRIMPEGIGLSAWLLMNRNGQCCSFMRS